MGAILGADDCDMVSRGRGAGLPLHQPVCRVSLQGAYFYWLTFLRRMHTLSLAQLLCGENSPAATAQNVGLQNGKSRTAKISGSDLADE